MLKKISIKTYLFYFNRYSIFETYSVQHGSETAYYVSGPGIVSRKGSFG